MYVCAQVHVIVENKVNLRMGAVHLLLETFSHLDLGLVHKLDWLASKAQESEDQILVLLFARKHFMAALILYPYNSSTANFLNGHIPKMV